MMSWTNLEISTDQTAAAMVLFAEPGAQEILGASAQRQRARAAIEVSGFDSQEGRWLDVLGDGLDAPRLVIVGRGGAADDGPAAWTSLGGHVVEAMRSLHLASVRLPSGRELGGDEAQQSLLTGALLHSFQAGQARRESPSGFKAKCLVIEESDLAAAEVARRVACAVNRARAWVEQPANLLTPTAFANDASMVLAERGLKVRILGVSELEAMGAGGLLAVGRASEHEPKLVVAEWRGDPSRDAWDAALVGKGLTFDAGGLNLKTRPVIEKMKFDMAGAAAVLGAMELAASRHARVNVVAVVPMAENVLGGRGYRPGDVIRSLSGLTIEVLNTDAEGRLVLADGITYAIQHYAPEFIVDVATLTGAVTAVLHEEFGALYASDDRLACSLLQAGSVAGEHLWRLPLSAAQDYIVDSEVADVANWAASGFVGIAGGSPAGGAKFLERFARGTKWAHLDIAGTAWATRRTGRSGKGATGFGVVLLDRWLDDLETVRPDI